MQSLEGERDDRAATLAEKERRIEGYKAKERTLKKFKLLLDKKLAEVVESVQPKDSLIEKLNQDLSELEHEFERQLIEQRALEEKIDQKRQHAAILQQAPSLQMLPAIRFEWDFQPFRLVLSLTLDEFRRPRAIRTAWGSSTARSTASGSGQGS